MESHKDSQAPAPADHEDELEQREYSSPPCYLHEFEPPPQPDSATKKPERAPDAPALPKSKDTK